MRENRDSLDDERFSYREIKGGRVQIACAGRVVKTLSGREAARFLGKIAGAGPRAAQLLMAKATGPFKFGNERAARLAAARKRGP